MKRSRLKSGKGLRSKPAAKRADPGAAARRVRLAERPHRLEEDYGARAAWKALHYGKCAVCGRRQRLIRHHVILEQHVRAEGGNPWDLRNALDLGAYCRCHDDHHHPGVRRKRIALALIPAEAVTFAVELLGRRATIYLERYYDADSDESRRTNNA